MKTIEEKAKAYDEALEKAKMSYHTGDYDKDTLEMLEIIFPELAENKDEEVRKALLELVHDTTGDELWIDYNVHKEEALAWLERQGGYANFRNKAQVGDRITKNEDGVLVNLSQLKRVAKPSEKQGEQEKDILEDAILDGNEDGLIAETIKYKKEKQGEKKPVIEMKTAAESLGVDSETYNKIVDECLFGEQKLTEFERGLFDMLTDISKPRTADCVKSHSEKLLSIARKMIALEQKPAWSEEDEAVLDALIRRLKGEDIHVSPHLAVECLKSIKERIGGKV